MQVNLLLFLLLASNYIALSNIQWWRVSIWVRIIFKKHQVIITMLKIKQNQPRIHIIVPFYELLSVQQCCLLHTYYGDRCGNFIMKLHCENMDELFYFVLFSQTDYNFCLVKTEHQYKINMQEYCL